MSDKTSDEGCSPGRADDYIGCPDVHDRDAFACRVSGDSMAPEYGAGDIAVFSPNEPPKSGDDCYVRFCDGLTTFKRVYFETIDAARPTLRLQPLNPKYAPRMVPARDVEQVCPAVYHYRRVNLR